MKTIIFDLDETVINSNHRVKPYIKPCGSLDLNLYRKNATLINILKDKKLPLFSQIAKFKKQGYKIVICTARQLKLWDRLSFFMLGLKYDVMLSRNNISDIHSSLSDDLYKLIHLNNAGLINSNSIMFEDNKSVKSLLRQAGLTVLCAHKINKRLEK
jgi:hypothetical protein